MEKAKSVNHKPVKLLLEIIFNKKQKTVKSVRTSNLSSNTSLSDIKNNQGLLNKSSVKMDQATRNSKEKVIQIKIKLDISDVSESDLDESFTSESLQNRKTVEVESTTMQNAASTLNLSANGVKNEAPLCEITTMGEMLNKANVDKEKNGTETVFFDVPEKERSESIQSITKLIDDHEVTESHDLSIWQKIFEKIQNKYNSSSEDKKIVETIHELIMEKYKQALYIIKQRTENREQKTVDITTTTQDDSKNDNLEPEKSFFTCTDTSNSTNFMSADEHNLQEKNMLAEDTSHNIDDVSKTPNSSLKSKLSWTRSLDNIIEYDEHFLNAALGKEMQSTTFDLQTETSLYDKPVLEKEIARSEAEQSIGSSNISLLISETDCRRPTGICNLYSVVNKTKNPNIRDEQQSPANSNDCEYDSLDNLLLDHKGHNLMKKYAVQNEIIQQSSKAVKICRIQPDFFGKETLVEAEKILLVAGLRKEAIEDELKKLDYEEIDHQITSCTVKIRNIHFYTKPQSFEENKNHSWYYVCVLHQGSTIYATKTVLHIESTISFEDKFDFENIPSDYQIKVSIYALLQKNKKHKKLKGKPREELKSVPASCYISTKSYFILWGTSIIRPSQSHQTVFSLSKVPLEAPITSFFRANIETRFKIHIKEVGFLTLGVDYKGHPIWNRRWCHLDGSILKYWNYPNEQDTCAPMGEINLQKCVSFEIRRADKDICPSPRTLLLRMNMNEDGKQVQRRYFLSADNYEDFDRWIRELNIVLYYLRKWSNYTSYLKH